MVTNNSHNNNSKNNNNQKRNFNQRSHNNPRSNYRKGNRNDFKKNQRYHSDSLVARIVKPKREETVEDIKMDIDKLEKDIHFEIKQIRSIKLGL